MASLDPALRGALEKAVVEARTRAEEGARAALAVLAVNDSKPFTTLTSEQRALRNLLRAKARQLGSDSQYTGFASLIEEVAYVHWHRMLFARFLAENNLLVHPEAGVSVTLEECEELAPEEGDLDKWATAARYAGNMLPGIFSVNDPSVQVRFAPEARASLEAILSSLPSPVFAAEDGLGWTYQFWQSQKKNEVSSRGLKIEKLDLAAYSQLFTEDYIVRFLLENSLGAWWASRNPSSPLVREFKFLRFLEDGTPAAGTFPGWPEQAAEVTVMDPCCGSGHFLVVAFEMLRRMRMEAEGLDGAAAAEAVLRDNMFGLEIDPRCVQIAAFALALAAWKVGGYRELPSLNIACTGIPVAGQLEAWTKLAAGDDDMKRTLERLHGLFVNAPDLGSLISPSDVPINDRMFAPEFARVAPLLHYALSRETDGDPVAAVFGTTALGVARAAELLSGQYTMVTTNVPYLARGKQGDVLKGFIDLRHKDARADLATAFVERCQSFCLPSGTYSVVTPQNWLFLGSYRKFRQEILKEQTVRLVAKLGEHAFESSAAAGAFVALTITGNVTPDPNDAIVGLDVSDQPNAESKANALRQFNAETVSQVSQLRGPDSRITFTDSTDLPRLELYARSYQGVITGDAERFRRRFWELSSLPGHWEFVQSTVESTKPFGGLEFVLDWSHEGRNFARMQGLSAWKKSGVTVSLMRELRSALYLGCPFDSNVATIVPKDQRDLPAVLAFCFSAEFNTAVRRLDSKVNVTNATLVKVPFDLQHWKSVAEEVWPKGPPQPYSDDLTQWLFQGDPVSSTDALQVAVARLLGYEWPQQQADRLSHLSILDGMLPLSFAAGQDPAVERLRRVLNVAYGVDWSAQEQTRLLRLVGFEAKGLDAWLRDGFFEQHCKLFHNRPFIWHIWDGRKDGFSVLVNYHKLNAANLDKLIYTYLGEWVRTQRAAEEAGIPGANARLVAALELQRQLEWIRDGNSPYDIYVRWKPLYEQPIGWSPDLNDGVRLNIRPFVEAGVLRSRVKVNWNNDRGRDPDGTERVNDVHLTLPEKLAAREGKAE